LENTTPLIMIRIHFLDLALATSDAAASLTKLDLEAVSSLIPPMSFCRRLEPDGMLTRLDPSNVHVCGLSSLRGIS
jgi:hypothetical protein